MTMKKIFTLFTMLAVLLIAKAQNGYRTLTPQQMQHDLSVLQSAWTNLHPGLYRFNSPEQIQSYFTALNEQCSRPMDERKFYVLLAQLSEKIKCGHTFLNPLNLDRATQQRILPERVVPVFFEVVDGKKFIITHNASGIDAMTNGDEITAINNIPVRRIIDSLLTVSRSDGRNALGKKLNNINQTPDEADAYSLFDIFFPLFFPSNGGIMTLTVSEKKKSVGLGVAIGKDVRDVDVYLVTPNERVMLYEKLYGKIPAGEQSWKYKMLNKETAYMKFGTFSFWNSKFDTKKYIDSIFLDLSKRSNIKNLVVDIRNNEGGDNSGDYILSYLTDKKIGCDDPDRRCYRYLTIPDSLLGYLDTWDNSFKKPKDPQQFTKNELGLYEQKTDGKPCSHIEPKPYVFTGNKYLLTNAKNSSAGFEMARNFRTAGLGKIVGETTGGSQQGINGGEFFFLTLPESKFEVDLPLIYNYHPNKEDRGIEPDAEIKTTQKDIDKNRDAQLDFVLDVISGKKKIKA